MLRVFLWSVAVIAALPFALGLWFWYLSQPEVSEKIYDLAGGEQVVARKEVYSDYDVTTQTVISLRSPDGSIEEVERVNYGESSTDLPNGPFELKRDGKNLVLRDDTRFYVKYSPARTAHDGAWQYQGDLMRANELPLFGRALMPDAYARGEKFDATRNHPPFVPSYKIERWAANKNVVVLVQSGQNSPYPKQWNYSDKEQRYQKWIRQNWPQRLVFRDWKFDAPGTLALNKLWLRPVPANVEVELLMLDIPNEGAIPTDDRRVWEATKIAGARVVSRQKFALTALPRDITMPAHAGRTQILQMRGVCADPNPNLIHFKWRVGDGKVPENWAIAHRGQQRSLREANSGNLPYLIGPPYLFVKFQWKPRVTKAKPKP